MEQLSAVRQVMASAYVAIEDPDEGSGFYIEGEPAEVEIERTEDDEIRVGIHVRGGRVEAAGIYLSRSEAIRFVLAVAQAVGDR